jgi:hypothetical protein
MYTAGPPVSCVLRIARSVAYCVSHMRIAYLGREVSCVLRIAYAYCVYIMYLVLTIEPLEYIHTEDVYYNHSSGV